jgi:enoyl-CoA hydratase
MTYLLTHSIGASNAAQMVLTGDPVDAERALRMGLVSELVPPAELGERACALAATIASRPPIAAQTGKANLRAAYAMPLEAAVGYERDLQTICFATADAVEGRAAFKERRPGVFSGN